MTIRKRHSFFKVIIREAGQIRDNHSYRFLLFLGPIISIVLLFYIFRQGVVKELDIAVVDQDKSVLSIKIRNALEASPYLSVSASPPSIFQAREMLEKGVVEAIVLLPSGMEKDVLLGIQANVPAYINGTNVLVAGIIQNAILKTMGTVSAGIQLKQQLLSGKNESLAMARIQPVGLQQHVLFNPYSNYNYFLNSALLNIMLYLFAFLSSIYTFGNELKRGTGPGLLETSSGSVRIAVAGKLIPYIIIFSGFAMLINFLLFRVEGMPLNGSFPLLISGQMITVITYQLMGLWLVAATYNLRLSLSIASAYSMMAITFSGLTFPLEGMPKIAQLFSTIFPFTWWEKLFISQALRGAPITEALLYIGYILLFLLFSFTGFRLYKQRLNNEKFWGKA